MLLWVSLKRVECHGGSCDRSSCGGGGDYHRWGRRMREKALHDMARNGYVFHGTGPSCSQGKNLGSKSMPLTLAHAHMCALDRLGTVFGSCRDLMKAVACYHIKKVQGWGRLFPPCAGVWARMGRVRP